MVDEASYLSEDEIQSLINSCKNALERMFLLTLVYTGARISEIVGLVNDNNVREDAFTPGNINYSRKIITLRNLKAKKFRRLCKECAFKMPDKAIKCICGSTTIETIKLNKRWKIVNMPDEFLSEIKDYISKNNIKQDDAIFSFSRINGYYIIRNISKRAGIERIGKHWVHPHTMRHSYVMRGINRDVKISYIQKQVGHSTTASLSSYMSLKKKDIEREGKKMWESIQE